MERLLYSEIRGAIQEQVALYLPFVIIIEISFVSAAVNQNMDNNFLSIRIDYSIGPLDAIDKLEITVPHN